MIVRRTRPSPDASVSDSANESRSPFQEEPDELPSSVPHTPGPGARACGTWPLAQARLDRRPQDSASMAASVGQGTVQPAQYAAASWTQMESHAPVQQVGSIPQTVLQQVASEHPGVACSEVHEP